MENKKGSEPKRDSNKQSLLIGLFFLVCAFIGIVGILYGMITVQKTQNQEIGTLKEELDVVGTEKELVERKASQLEQEVGTSVNLNNLLEQSRQMYDQDEAKRTEGALWIDHESETLFITLGALNGLSAGSRVAVYDGDKRVGYVRVQTPLDVISYVNPINQTIAEFDKDYYRAVVE